MSQAHGRDGVGETVVDRSIAGTAERLTPGRAARRRSGRTTWSLMRQVACVLLSASVGLVGCAGAGGPSPHILTAAEPTPAAQVSFASYSADQVRENGARAWADQPTSQARDEAALNNIGWTAGLIAALPVLVPVFVFSLPFGSWKAFR
jgi:hypothetical protein